jgi:hypothetical protein
MTIELTQDEFDSLLVMVGYAAGAAFKEGNRNMAYRFICIANKINANNPRWFPYEIPEEFQNAQ